MTDQIFEIAKKSAAELAGIGQAAELRKQFGLFAGGTTEDNKKSLFGRDLDKKDEEFTADPETIKREREEKLKAESKPIIELQKNKDEREPGRSTVESIRKKYKEVTNIKNSNEGDNLAISLKGVEENIRALEGSESGSIASIKKELEDAKIPIKTMNPANSSTIESLDHNRIDKYKDKLEKAERELKAFKKQKDEIDAKLQGKFDWKEELNIEGRALEDKLEAITSKDKKKKILQQFVNRYVLLRIDTGDLKRDKIDLSVITSELPDNIKDLLQENGLDTDLAKIAIDSGLLLEEGGDGVNTVKLNTKKEAELRLIDLIDSGKNPKEAIAILKEQGVEISNELVKASDALSEKSKQGLDLARSILAEEIENDADLENQLKALENLLDSENGDFYNNMLLIKLLEKKKKDNTDFNVEQKNRLKKLESRHYKKFGTDFTEQITSGEYDPKDNKFTKLQSQHVNVQEAYKLIENIENIDIDKLVEDNPSLTEGDFKAAKLMKTLEIRPENFAFIEKHIIKRQIKGYLQIKLDSIITNEIGKKIRGVRQQDLRMEIEKFLDAEPALEDWLDNNDRTDLLDSLLLTQMYQDKANIETDLKKDKNNPLDIINKAKEHAEKEIDKLFANGEITAGEQTELKVKLERIRKISELEQKQLANGWEDFKLGFDKRMENWGHRYHKLKGYAPLAILGLTMGLLGGGGLAGASLGAAVGIGAGGIIRYNPLAKGYFDSGDTKEDLRHERKLLELEDKLNLRTADKRKNATLAYVYSLGTKGYTRNGTTTNLTKEEMEARLRFGGIDPQLARQVNTPLGLLSAMSKTEGLIT